MHMCVRVWVGYIRRVSWVMHDAWKILQREALLATLLLHNSHIAIILTAHTQHMNINICPLVALAVIGGTRVY
jgi:hypothetical protein